MGRRTLQVYVFHQPIIILMQGLGLFNLLENTFNEWFKYIYILIAMIVTLFLSLRLFDRILDYIKNNMFEDIE